MMNLNLASSPHQHIRRTTGQVMRLVIYALIPGILLQTWFFGFGTLIQICLATVTAIITEACVLELRKRDFERSLQDYSAVVTAILLAISIPPFAPWWLIVIGTFFAIAIVKQLYGGLGFNLFNPAMAAYVMLLVSFPLQMTQWLPPQSLAQYGHDLTDAMYAIFTGFTRDGFSLNQIRFGIDGTTMATPLDTVKTLLSKGLTYTESLEQRIFDSTLYSVNVAWSWISLAYLAGGLLLIKQRVISWHIPGSMLIALIVMATFMSFVDGDRYASSIFHLFNGSIIVGAFFIATDPVSASTTPKGRIIFGAAIGCWVYLIRTWGGYPDAVAFAVIIMNMTVPLIDYYTQPRVYGHNKRAKERKV